MYSFRDQEAVLACVRDSDVRRVRVAWADHHGVSRSKVVTASAFPSIVRNGLRTNVGTFLNDSGGTIAIDPFGPAESSVHRDLAGGPDVVVRPDPATFSVLPWAPHTGWVTGDLFFRSGEPFPYSPRVQLRKALSETAGGVCPIVGIELEFHLTRCSDVPRTLGAMGEPGTSSTVSPVNCGFQHQSEADLDAVGDVLDVLQEHLEDLGLPLRTLESELGPSQFELTLDAQPAMEAADAAFLVKNAAKIIAKRHGHHVTFMPRPALPGFVYSGWHMHLSVVDTATGRNLFVPENDREPLSRYGRHFVGGLIRHGREGALLSNPTVTAYRRFRSNSLAPDRLGWGQDHRGAMIRVTGDPGDGSTHIENRIGDPAANGYLYVAGQLLSGFDGVARGEEPEPPTDRPYEADSERLPGGLPEAIELFEHSEFFRKALGDDFVRFYVTHKRSEAGRFAASDLNGCGAADGVSEWEQREYFDLY